MFPIRIRELRKEKKLTAKELGSKFNLAESTISGYETGARKPDMETLEKFADFFEVSVDYLLGRTNVRSPKLEEDEIPKNINVAYLGGVKHELTPEVARRLKEDIELFERLKKQFMEDKKNEKK